MSKELLSDAQCRTGEKSLRGQRAKAANKVFYLNDGDGLRLQIRPDGKKYWMLRYTLAGKESTYLIGTYPVTTLADARVEAEEKRKLVAKGDRPSVARRVNKLKRIQSGSATFKAIATEWLARSRQRWSPAHYERNEGLLRRLLYKKLGSLPITEISEATLLAVLKEHYDSGIAESARRARGVAQQVFAYAKDTHRATHNPARELAKSSVLAKPPVTHFAALKATQVGPMLNAMVKSGVDPVTRGALLLMLYTGVRDGALRAAKWSEFDLDGGTWLLPRRKSRKHAPGEQQRIPLPKQAVGVLHKLAKLTRKGEDPYVFASRGKAGYLAENTLRLALHGLGFKVTVHGFRSLITDLLNEQGFNADAIERQLDHVPQDKVRAAYLRSDFFEYRRTMMQWLADWADAARHERKAPPLPHNVIPMRRVA